jgi:DNA modification methylase
VASKDTVAKGASTGAARSRMPRKARVTLSWLGRQPARDVCDRHAALESPDPYRLTERTATSCALAEASSENAPQLSNTFFLGDAHSAAKALLARGMRGKFDLVYADPPYASKARYDVEARLDGDADGRLIRAEAYDDRWNDAQGGLPAYLEMLDAFFEVSRRLLSPSGSLWIQLDWRASYLARVLLDEHFGRDGFINEIVWKRAPNLGRQAASSQFGRTLDTIVVYGNSKAKLNPPTRLELLPEKAVRFDEEGRAYSLAPRGDYTDLSIERLDREGRVHRSETGRVYIKYFLEKTAGGRYGRQRRVDALWDDIAPMRHAASSERTGYPTQKPLLLLDRIIRASTPAGGWVADLFSGSGTTAVAAHLAGRNSVSADRSPLAQSVTRARLLALGAPLEIYALTQASEPVLHEAGAAKADGAGEATIAVQHDGAQYVVALSSEVPPIAWAVDTSTSEGVFTVAWHSERKYGKITTPCASTAVLKSTPKRVRLYFDSGAVQDIAVQDIATQQVKV